jgi:hypothetical protein
MTPPIMKLKPRLIRRWALLGVGSLGLVTVGLVGLLKSRGVSIAELAQHPGTLSDCPADVASDLENPAFGARPARAASVAQRPIKVVVKPWAGRHNVYGVFSLPIGDPSSQTGGPPPYITIDLPGRQTYCAAVVKIDPSWVGLPDRPDQEVVIGLLHTRTALWLLGHGQKADLQNPENWSLHQRSGQPSPAAVKPPPPDRDPDSA